MCYFFFLFQVSKIIHGFMSMNYYRIVWMGNVKNLYNNRKDENVSLPLIANWMQNYSFLLFFLIIFLLKSFW